MNALGDVVLDIAQTLPRSQRDRLVEVLCGGDGPSPRTKQEALTISAGPDFAAMVGRLFEVRGQSSQLVMVAQKLGAEGVEGSRPHAVRRERRPGQGSCLHLRGGLIHERQQQRVTAMVLVQQPARPGAEGPGLAAAWPGEHRNDGVRRLRRLPLLIVQLAVFVRHC